MGTAQGAAFKRKNDPAAMRARVLDAAAALFQAQGYGATTTLEIARAAGVSAGAMHHHFPTKKAIGLAVIRERAAQAVRETWIEPVATALDLGEAIRAVMDSISDGIDGRGAVQGCPVNNLAIELSLADPDFRAEIDAIFAEWRGAIAERRRRDSASQGDEAEDFATLVVAAYSGAMAQAKAGQTSAPLRICAAAIARMCEGR